MATREMVAYTPPIQSPFWDDVLPLAEMLQQAKFFILRKRHPHGDLVDVVMSEYQKGDNTWYEIRSLNHDCCGVTCEADGSIGAHGLPHYIEKGLAEITADPDKVLRHIWEVMECHPNVEKLFTEYNA